MEHESLHACMDVVLFTIDFATVLTCTAIHFIRGTTTDTTDTHTYTDTDTHAVIDYIDTNHGIADATITLTIWYAGGLCAGFFHFFRHELGRQKHRSVCRRVAAVMLIFAPSYYIAKWNSLRVQQKDSQTVKSWTASLMLFYCSIASLLQAMFQSYLVVLMWYDDIQPYILYILVVGALYFTLYSVYGICNYVFIQYFDEIHEHLDLKDKVVVILAFLLSIGGRVSAMAVVMVTVGWKMIFGPCIALLSNLLQSAFACCRTRSKDEERTAAKSKSSWSNVVLVVLLAFLSTMTISRSRTSTCATSFLWVFLYVFQFESYHETPTHFFVWVVPTAAQVSAFVFVMIKWCVFKKAFERFNRVAGN